MKALLIFLFITFSISVFGQKGNANDFLPKGYVIARKLSGDLNKDGIEASVLIIKEHYKHKIYKDKYGVMSDENRSGIIVLFNKTDHYELALKNYKCFLSEEEGGGRGYAPTLMAEIKDEKLYLKYDHGMHGYRQYTFRYQNADLELIGYDKAEYNGAILNAETSINFLTHKKLMKRIKENPDRPSGAEVYDTAVADIKVNKLIKLSAVKNFDKLNMNEY